MTANEISACLKYANLHMAAEAFLINPKTGTNDFSGQALIEALQAGNNHASRFTGIAAKQFESEWEVVAHQPNTSTGFSGTLFRCIVTDPARGLTTGDLVMSFRSTEFIDDALRDSVGTNESIGSTGGWAFGQIADMEKWYAELSKLTRRPPLPLGRGCGSGPSKPGGRRRWPGDPPSLR